jgi:formylglycine-generating enzyme required for sulfatase activity
MKTTKSVGFLVLTVGVLAAIGGCTSESAIQAQASAQQDEAAKSLGIPKELTLDLGNKVSMKLVLIPAGKFVMGHSESELREIEKLREIETMCVAMGAGSGELFGGPQHEVTISKPFYMGVTHVTVDQFAAFVKDSGYKTGAEKDGFAYGVVIKDGKLDLKKIDGCCWRKPSFDQKGDHPVVQVSWNDAKAFCDWLSKKSGKTVQLPTEARWEYACRAETKTAYPWGDDPDKGKGWANCADQSLKKKLPNAPADWKFFSWDDGFAFTSPVGSFKANAFGLYDMIGNAWEWCQDRLDYAKEAATAPFVDTREGRVLRGGSWIYDPQFCRSARRCWGNPVNRDVCVGFRVSVDLK